jgi:RNA polymerase sigma factor (TIGR02999 family)
MLSAQSLRVSTVPSADITALLSAWSQGNKDAFGDLMPLVYKELHRIAECSLRSERSDHTLQATALVNEAYLKLIDQKQYNSRSHFLAVASRAMRSILVDHARARLSAKRGGGAVKVSLDKLPELSEPGRDEELVALDEALTRLAQLDEVQSRIVEMRFFSGMTIEQTAQAMGISPATVKRHWSIARAWLNRELGSDDAHA